MKKLCILSIVICSIYACPPLPHQVAFAKIEYEAYTRGSSKYILLEKGKIKYVFNQQDTVSKPLKNKHYKDLYELLKDIDLTSLDKLDVPSTKHQSDGSLAATLTVTDIAQQEFISPTFDDNNPPEEIKGLVDYLHQLIEE